jgi:penicillin-binding protein 2
VVDDPDGTAHDSLGNSQLAIAGKTGTAQAGAGVADHAWFAGYAPADAPRVVVVVALEHAGDASVAAVPVARLVFERLAELGYLHSDAN